MILPTTIQFLAELSENNHRDWFDEHRDDYQAAKSNVTDVVDQLIDMIVSFDEGLSGVTA